MKIFAAFFQIILFLASALVVHAQSLADLAKKEKERRSKITKARVITVEEAAKYITEQKPPASENNPEEKGPSMDNCNQGSDEDSRPARVAPQKTAFALYRR